MTTQQINERIAKLCGWASKEETIERVSSGYDWTEKYTTWSYPGKGRHLKPQNYAGSLDCCREFESKFTAPEQTEYAVKLRYIVTRNVERDHEPLNPDTLRIPDGRYYCATSLERCEAFLRMKGQWE